MYQNLNLSLNINKENWSSSNKLPSSQWTNSVYVASTWSQFMGATKQTLSSLSSFLQMKVSKLHTLGNIVTAKSYLLNTLRIKKVSQRFWGIRNHCPVANKLPVLLVIINWQWDEYTVTSLTAGKMVGHWFISFCIMGLYHWVISFCIMGLYHPRSDWHFQHLVSG